MIVVRFNDEEKTVKHKCAGTEFVLVCLISQCLLLAGCGSRHSHTSQALPGFEAVGSDGRLIKSSDLLGMPSLVVFFDTESVLAWRNLSELQAVSNQQGEPGIRLIAIGSTRDGIQQTVDIEELKKEYALSLPILPDTDDHLSKLFQPSNLCDSIHAYDSRGTLIHAYTFNDSRQRLGEIIARVVNKPAANVTAGAAVADRIREMKVVDSSGNEIPLPVSQRKLTVVNLFDAFCSECDTGDRLDTLNALAKELGRKVEVVAVFSREKFALQDIENLRAIVGISGSAFQADFTDPGLRTYKGRFLVLFNTQKEILWQEKSDWSEKDIYREIKRITERSGI